LADASTNPLTLRPLILVAIAVVDAVVDTYLPTAGGPPVHNHTDDAEEFDAV
jgi:hypothetical protein